MNRKIKREFVKCGGVPPTYYLKFSKVTTKLLYLISRYRDRSEEYCRRKMKNEKENNN